MSIRGINPFMNMKPVKATTAVRTGAISGEVPSGGSSGFFAKMGSNGNSKTAGLGPDTGVSFVAPQAGKQEGITGRYLYTYG